MYVSMCVCEITALLFCRMPKKAASPSGTWQLVVAWLLGLWLAAKLLLKIQKPKDDLWDE